MRLFLAVGASAAYCWHPAFFILPRPRCHVTPLPAVALLTCPLLPVTYVPGLFVTYVTGSYPFLTRFCTLKYTLTSARGRFCNPLSHNMLSGIFSRMASFGNLPSVQTAQPPFVSVCVEALPDIPATEGRVAPLVASQSTATTGTGPVAQWLRLVIRHIQTA